MCLRGFFRDCNPRSHPPPLQLVPFSCLSTSRGSRAGTGGGSFEASEKKREKILLTLHSSGRRKIISLSRKHSQSSSRQAAQQQKVRSWRWLGSVRDDHDSKRVYQLRLLVNELLPLWIGLNFT